MLVWSYGNNSPISKRSRVSSAHRSEVCGEPGDAHDVFIQASKRGCGVLLVVAAVFLAGCGDPVRTTLQPVLLKVSSSVSGEPVADAHVLLKYDYERARPMANEKSSEVWHWHSMKEFWDRSPWASGVTDNRGQVSIGVRYTVLDRTWGAKPPPWRDEVSGRPFLIKLKTAKEEEEASLLMRPGTSVRGKTFYVEVLEIHQPYYVDTKTAGDLSASSKPNH